MPIQHDLSPLVAAGDTAHTLAAEFDHAFEQLGQCIKQLEHLLNQAELDRGKLTSIRLKIAQLRLERGSIVARIATCLRGQMEVSDSKLVQELRRGHDDLLRVASAHTGEWTIEAIQKDWEGYRTKARHLAGCWMEKMRWEQVILLPLLARCKRA